MLKLILGRAKSGKTAKIMSEIKALTEEKRENIVLLVPEQYSHEAETELLRVCGDGLSLYAEVLSFTRLALRVEGETGRREGKMLDKGGRLLCMALSIDAVGSRLRVYGAARRQAELQDRLLAAIDEMKSACVTPGAVEELARSRSDVLGDKLRDLALIYEAYEATVAQGRLDPMDRLSYLAEKIGGSSLAGGTFYLDGFTDFTHQELEALRALIRGGADLTVCLTCEGLTESREIFESSRRAAAALKRIAGESGEKCVIESVDAEQRTDAMGFLERELFSFDEKRFDGQENVQLVCAPGMAAECEAAAAKCVELVRETGCRYRDIAVAVRGYDDYKTVLESAFARYGVPLYSAGKSAASAKPLPALIDGAFDIVAGGWSYDDVTAYMKTGLTGLPMEERLALEDYAFLWSIHGGLWTREGSWRMHPDGYGGEFTEETRRTLDGVNAAKRALTRPLKNFEARGRQAHTALGQAQALAALFEELELAQTLEGRSTHLEELGMLREAAEEKQLWEIAVSALEQCAGILGESEMTQEDFGRLYRLVLSKYDVGTIPLTLDSVLAGDMDRMRRRHIKHLLLLGADATRIPALQAGGGVLSDDEADELREQGLDLGNGAEDRLCHEFALIYNCLTLPSDTLYISWCASGGDGAALPSFLVTRAEGLFGVKPEAPDMDLCRTNAPAAAFELALCPTASSRAALCAAAAGYFYDVGRGEELARVKRLAQRGRGRLSEKSVRALYGGALRLSASRIDKFAACRFSYFMQYGLKARPRRPAQFAPPEMGTFMHVVLEKTAREISAGRGFAETSDAEVGKICDKYVAEYIHEKLDDLTGKSARFRYLFLRMGATVRSIVCDMASELARSDFAPLDFELDFGDAQSFSPIELGEGKSAVTLTGIADRVDGWVHEGTLYLRVVDYKTGRKKFSLSDVWYGMGLQMLLYLFALGRAGEARYKMPVQPAGVLYIPARDGLVSAGAEMSGEEIEQEKQRARRRSGLLLDDDAVLRAMERGGDPQYIPVTVKNGEYTGEALSSYERMGKLARHIDKTLRLLSGEMRRGSIDADPFFRSGADNACAYCDFAQACRFDEKCDCRRYLARMKAEKVWEKLDGEDENGL